MGSQRRLCNDRCRTLAACSASMVDEAQAATDGTAVGSGPRFLLESSTQPVWCVGITSPSVGGVVPEANSIGCLGAASGVTMLITGLAGLAGSVGAPVGSGPRFLLEASTQPVWCVGITSPSVGVPVSSVSGCGSSWTTTSGIRISIEGALVTIATLCLGA